MQQSIDNVNTKRVAYLSPIENPEQVNKRRKAVGLQLSAEYDKAMRQLQQERDR